MDFSFFFLQDFPLSNAALSVFKPEVWWYCNGPDNFSWLAGAGKRQLWRGCKAKVSEVKNIKQSYEQFRHIWGLNRGSSILQPDALPLGQTGLV